jgi:hypothetical protein
MELQVQAHFLVVAYHLARFFPSQFQILLSLEGSPPPVTMANVPSEPFSRWSTKNEQQKPKPNNKNPNKQKNPQTGNKNPNGQQKPKRCH